MIKIAVAEDNTFLAKSIEEKCSFFEDLSLKFIGVNGLDLLEKLATDHNIDLILMDIEMPEMDGIQTTALVKEKYPHIKVLMLTVFDNEANIFNAIKAGADGYLLKDENTQMLYQRIIEVMEGGAPMSPSIAVKALKLLRTPIDETPAPFQQEEINLTKREIAVLEQLSKGLNYKEIGSNLYISSSTVRKHIENIYKKLHVRNKMEAVIKAKAARII